MTNLKKLGQMQGLNIAAAAFILGPASASSA